MIGLNVNINAANKLENNINMDSDMQGQGGAVKKKVISKDAMRLPSNYQYTNEYTFKANEKTLLEPEKRKEERVQRHKLQFLSMQAELSKAGDETIKQKLLHEIDNFKERKKEEYLKHVLAECLSQDI